jgi:hypothetical protein
MKGIVLCQKCKHHQPWISQSRYQLGNIATSNCRKCGKRNRFYPHRFGSQGNLVERRGRKPAVHFRRRPDWTIILQLTSESRARNRGSIVDEEELAFQETEEFRERVQERIDHLLKVKEALE